MDKNNKIKKNNTNYYNPNAQNLNNNRNNLKRIGYNQGEENKYIISSKRVKQLFNIYAIERKFLNKKGFNDALESLFSKLPVPELHHTYLSDRLYSIFNLRGNSQLLEEEFIKCIREILSSRNNRLHLSMMAMMSGANRTRKNISLDEIKKFFYESFVQGYKHLAWQINQSKEDFKNKNLPVVSISQMEAWARGFERKIKNGFEKDLKMFDPDISDSISFEQYIKWLNNDQTLYIKYGFKTIMIATSLIGFDDVEYDEN